MGPIVLGLALLLGAVGVELGVRVAGIDGPMVNRALYYQRTDREVHQASTNPFLHYELAPGATYTGKSRFGGEYQVRINNVGARGADVPEAKAPGVFRILFLGASTVYGAAVSDDQTLPAGLERSLDAMAARTETPVDFEVWNLGTSAYVTSQMARLGVDKLVAHPDIDLVVLIRTNVGRRAFLWTDDWETADRSDWYIADPDMWLENFPAAEVPVWLHLALLPRVASYRYWVAWNNRDEGTRQRGNATTEALTERELQGLVDACAAADVPFVLARYAQGSHAQPLRVPTEGAAGQARHVDLQRPDRPQEFYRTHPPPEYLAEHGANLATELLGAGLLPLPPAD